jgi:transcriptional regulator with XRE-family HTH domain
LADYLGVTKQTISNYENGIDVSESNLEKIAEFFGFTTEEFINLSISELLTRLNPKSNEETNYNSFSNKKTYKVSGEENVVGESNVVYRDLLIEAYKDKIAMLEDRIKELQFELKAKQSMIDEFVEVFKKIYKT